MHRVLTNPWKVNQVIEKYIKIMTIQLTEEIKMWLIFPKLFAKFKQT
jgi:hypothetical protein